MVLEGPHYSVASAFEKSRVIPIQADHCDAVPGTGICQQFQVKAIDFCSHDEFCLRQDRTSAKHCNSGYSNDLLLFDTVERLIKDIVFWKLKDHAEGADRVSNALKLKALLDGCSNVVPGILKSEAVLAQPSPAWKRLRTSCCTANSPAGKRSMLSRIIPLI